MGWLFGWRTRKELIAHLTTEVKTSAHCCVGNTLWAVANTDSRPLILCVLLKRHGDSWGYKDMSESMHPYYFSCPLSYLKMVPDGTEGTCPEWRQQVRDYHARFARLSVGQEIDLVNSRVARVTIVSLKPLVGVDANGQQWRIPRNSLA